MSGRKDYNYRLTAARRAREQAERAVRAALRAEAEREREDRIRNRLLEEEHRAAEVQRRLDELRRRTQAQLGTTSVARTGEFADFDDSNRRKNAERPSEAVAKRHSSATWKPGVSEMISSELLGMASELGLSQETIDGLCNSQQPDQASMSLLDVCEEMRQLNHEIQRCKGTLKSRLDGLESSQEVKYFAADQLNALQTAVCSLLGTEASEEDAKERLQALQDALLEAERIEATSIETAEKFEERNSVLKDILESLQEIGFFVQAPEYVNPNRPDQAVIIRANRADQTMEARVGLNSEIESDWQGVHGEYCTDAFLDYVRQMNLRGVEITSQNPQLVPTLKQKNSLTLPSANDSRSGNE